jgi:hypothetical protein
VRLHAIARGLLRQFFVAALLLAAILTPLRAQDPVTIDGFVTGEGQPLRGASVRIAEFGLSATTDANGRYSLIVPSSRVRGQTVTLTARATRFQPRSVSIQLLGGSLTENFELASSRTAVTEPARDRPLEPRAAVTADRADSGALGSGFDLSTGLTGRIPGLRVATSTARGGSALLLSRGLRSINGSSNALIVLDGIPLEGTNFTSAAQRYGFGGFDYGAAIQDINPSDVLSVRLLQGAEATMSYGGRAANGVVEITSRNGRGLNGIEVAASHRLSFDSPLRMPSFQDRYGQGSQGLYSFFDGQGGGVNDAVPESWGPELTGQPRTQASFTEPRFGAVRYWLPRTGNLRNYFAAARSNISDASVVGGNDRGDFRVSLRNVSSPMLSPESSIGRRGISARGSERFGSRLHGGAHLSYVSTTFDNLSGSGFDEGNPTAALLRTPRQVDLDSLRVHLRDANKDQITWIYAGNRNNPWFSPLLNHNGNDRSHVTVGGNLDVTLTPYLDAVGMASTDRVTEARSFSVERGWLGGFSTELGRSPFTAGGYQSQDVTAHEDNLEARLQAHPSARGDWRYAFAGGIGLRRNVANVSSVVFDSARVAGDTMATRVALEGRQDSSSAYTVGLFASASATFREAATVTLSLHRERADYLPKANETRAYPSALAQLDLRSLSSLFRDGTSVANLRASWTRTSSDLTPFMIRSIYRGAQSADDIALDSTTAISRGSTLVPEITTIMQSGIDLGFAANRLGLSLTFYDERTADLIVGGITEAMNAGALRNRGLQAALTIVPVNRGGVEWTANASVTRNSSAIESLGDTTSRLSVGPSRWGVSLEAITGQPFAAIVGTKFQRDASTGELLLVNGLPQPTAADTAVLGFSQPNWFGGIANTVRYGRAELSFLLDGQIGGKVFSATNMWGAVYGTLAETGFRPDTGIVIAGTDAATNQPNAIHVSTEDYYHALGAIAERWVYNASFMKLREVRLGTSFDVPSVAGFQNSRVEISLIGRNLAMWAKAPNIDPESVISTSSYQGFEFGQPPRARSVGLQFTIVP